ncbi:uncharacterized protein RCO7_02033 [Rhynchosporium graminicola]|uniref:Alternative oxidase n=1 Tax=Rhynchosporium graminicola TaxID=2792576 RepID=A0A1E1KTE9_9HELO|nr:uncharacterized protein RCO7_02033 [Rhynchosporium commune]
MINGVVRIKWWRYKYAVLAALVVNVILVNHFFFKSSFADFVQPRPAPGSKSTLGQAPAPASAPNGAVPQKTSAAKPGEPTYTYDPSLQEVIALDKVPPSTPRKLSLNDYDFDGPYIGWPLARTCNETKWQPGLVFICDNNSGGIGNIRNFILTCIRYGIEAGAAGLVMPRIQRRSDSDLGNLFTSGFQPFTYFFDENHFTDSMGKFCPQMKIYNDTDHFPNSQNKKEAKEFYPKDLNLDSDGCDARGVNRHLDLFRTKFDEWAVKYENQPSVDRPVTELAAHTITEMAKFAGQAGDVKKSPPKYLGVHLRTESDALGFWPDFKTQSEGYMKEAEVHKLKHAYIASGNATEGHKFGEIAAKQLGPASPRGLPGSVQEHQIHWLLILEFRDEHRDKKTSNDGWHFLPCLEEPQGFIQ